MYKRLIPQDFPMAFAINLIVGKELTDLILVDAIFGPSKFPHFLFPYL
jgi:hypothetical protein